MNVLLINPKAPDKNILPKFPLGLGYIAAVLRDAHHDVKVVDLNVSSHNGEGITKVLALARYDIVGLTGFITQHKEVKEIATIVKKHSKAVVILGGGLASVVPDFVLNETEVDVIVVGEGEVTIVELIKNLEAGKDIDNVDGIVYKNSDHIVRTPPRTIIRDLSTLPLPAWDLFPMERYLSNKAFGLPKRMISLISSRGCPYHCGFCFHGIFGHKYRFRSAKEIFEEINILKRNYDIEGIDFEDDTFFLNKKRVLKLCDMLQSHKVKVIWTCSGRVNLVDKELLLKMSSAGCTQISYGIESGSQEILDKIAKGIKIKQAEEAIKNTWDCGIIPHGFMMLGYPGETKISIQKSVEFCKKVGISAEFTIATPIPGTKLYNEALELNRIKSLKELIVGWGHWFEDVLVNMTDFSNHQLIEMKKKAEKEVFIHFLFKKHKHLLQMLLIEFKVNGFISLINRIWKGFRLIVRTSRNLGLSGIKPR